MQSLVMMGVAGCGKSSLGHVVAQAEGMAVIEGDHFHSPASLNKMREGIALDDADRDGWLDVLARQLQQRTSGVVLTCSALKWTYRNRLRAAAPGLGFVFLDIARDDARVRVAARAQTHFFAECLVDSQFAALERPDAEADVLRVDALAPLSQLQREVCAWLRTRGQE